jgi:hypothetical protein
MGAAPNAVGVGMGTRHGRSNGTGTQQRRLLTMDGYRNGEEAVGIGEGGRIFGSRIGLEMDWTVVGSCCGESRQAPLGGSNARPAL